MTRGVDLDLPSAMPGPLAAALVAASAEFPEIPRSGRGNYGPFPTLSDVLGAVRTILAEHGLAQQSLIDSEVVGPTVHVTIRTKLLHTSGATFVSPALCLVTQSLDPQKVGSAVSYGRRYSLMATLGVTADDDDDGNRAKTPDAPVAATPVPAPEQTWRTPEEAEARKLLKAAPKEVRLAIVRAFKEHFGVPLSDLGRDRHAEALSFVVEQLAVPDAPPDDPGESSYS